MKNRLQTERNIWRFGVGLLGGKSTIAMTLAALLYGYFVLVYVATHPIRVVYGNVEFFAELAGTFVSGAFLLAVLASVIVLRQRRTLVLLRLSPKVGPFIASLTSRIALLALLCLLPAVTLRALASVKYSGAVESMTSLVNVPMQGFLTSALTLIYIAVLLGVTFGWFRAPLRFACFPIYCGVMNWSRVTWQWVPFVICVIIVIGHRIWLRTDLADGVRVLNSELRQQPNLIERLNTWQLRRAARAMGDRSSSTRVTALLSTRPRALFTSFAVLFTAAYLTLMPSVMDASALSWFLGYMVSLLLASPSPIALGQIMLVPLGAERHNVGRILMNVWVRNVWFRLALGVMLGLIVRALCWWFDLYIFGAPHLRGNSENLPILLLWIPLMKALGLLGVAYAICWTMSASPRLFKSAGLLGSIPTNVVVVFTALGVAGNWLLQQFVPALNGADMDVVRFAIFSGALLPLIAWFVNRQLRPQWACANLGEISKVMQAWTAQRQKSLLLS